MYYHFVETQKFGLAIFFLLVWRHPISSHLWRFQLHLVLCIAYQIPAAFFSLQTIIFFFLGGGVLMLYHLFALHYQRKIFKTCLLALSTAMSSPSNLQKNRAPSCTLPFNFSTCLFFIIIRQLMVSWKSQAGYTTRSLPLLQTPFFSNVCIVGMRLYSLHVPPTFSWKSRWALEARSFLSESRKLNYIVILNAQRPPVAWKKNLSWFQCLPLSEFCNLAKWRHSVWNVCGVLSLSRAVGVVDNSV